MFCYATAVNSGITVVHVTKNIANALEVKYRSAYALF
jgi:hypothetical protein